MFIGMSGIGKGCTAVFPGRAVGLLTAHESQRVASDRWRTAESGRWRLSDSTSVLRF